MTKTIGIPSQKKEHIFHLTMVPASSNFRSEISGYIITSIFPTCFSLLVPVSFPSSLSLPFHVVLALYSSCIGWSSNILMIIIESPSWKGPTRILKLNSWLYIGYLKFKPYVWECCQNSSSALAAWGYNHSTREPVPVPDHDLVEKSFLIFSLVR